MSNETALVPVEQKRVLAQAKGIDIKTGVIVPTISQKDPNE